MGDHFRVTQIGEQRARDIVGHPAQYRLQRLTLTKGKDGIERTQYRFQGVYREGRVLQAFHAMTDIYSTGVKGGLQISVAAAGCEDLLCQEGKLTAAARNIRGKGSSDESPNGIFPSEVYVGQLNGDQAPDVLVIFPKGPALVFSQNPSAKSTRVGRRGN